MVNVAIIGASGQLASTLIDYLSEHTEHVMLGLVRRDPSTLRTVPRLKYVQTDYQDTAELSRIFKAGSVDVVMSFIIAHLDPDAAVSKRLVDAAIDAGVKRFVPSEWSVGRHLADAIQFLPWYDSKLKTRAYLEQVNTPHKVLEYTLFHSGHFTEYLGHPHAPANLKHIDTIAISFQPEILHALTVEGREEVDRMTFTSPGDVVKVVARALDVEQGKWPVWGGIEGQTVTVKELIDIVERVRGKKLTVERLKESDLVAGRILAKTTPTITHSSVTPEQKEAFEKLLTAGFLMGAARGAYTATREWNEILPDVKFLGIEEYLRSVFRE
ncbi:uncharacterized protein B0I36DRAFT_388623 [Microdochium trichocladiopsis]|uniref:NmrA-like domain-containing protein n=1 Tax=Microdochium trichocladiopsis TaxID=1682393 RepID=A0A9P9BKD8_9PEZI|nr:uncharacterized protein B0I36DRAFT_388623 [Microdochium trichocladiopsis]KAH7018406.1 hypothetical protein B0I36DRAFT_388623 [Microdochium trichocladiopsis]